MTRTLSGFKRTFSSMRSSSDDENINVSQTLNFSSDYLENNNTENTVDDPIILNNNFENVENMSDNDYFYKSSEDDEQDIVSNNESDNESISSFNTDGSDDLISIDENSYKSKPNKRQKRYEQVYCDVCNRSFASNLSRHEKSLVHKENLRLLNEKDDKSENETNDMPRIQQPISRYTKYHCEICDKDVCVSFKQVHEKGALHKTNKEQISGKKTPICKTISNTASSSSTSNLANKWTKYHCKCCDKYIAISYKKHHENSVGHKEAMNASSETSENSSLSDLIDTLEDESHHSNTSNKYSDEDIDAMMNKIDDLTSRNNSLEKKINDLEKRFNSFKDFMKKL